MVVFQTIPALFPGSGNSDGFADKALVITGVVPFSLLFLIDLVDFGPNLFLVFVVFSSPCRMSPVNPCAWTTGPWQRCPAVACREATVL